MTKVRPLDADESLHGRVPNAGECPFESRGMYVRRKTYEEKVLDVLKDLPRTPDLALLLDYEEKELSYLACARARDQAAGIAIAGPDVIAQSMGALNTWPLKATLAGA